MRIYIFLPLAAIFSCGAKPPEKKPLPGTAEGDATAASVDLTSPFALSCETKKRSLVYGTSMEEAFKILCAGDKKPSGTFVKILAGSPWSGAGDAKVYRLGPPEHDNAARTTKLTGGGTVEIPVSPRDYAERSLVYSLDPARAEHDGIKLVDGLKSDVGIGSDPANAATGLLGRAYSRLLIEKDVNYQHIVIEYEASHSSIKISDDIYIVSTKMTKAIQGIKDMYSVGIAYPLNGKNVVTSVIMTKTDNRNQPGVAAEALLKTFREGVQNVRLNAVTMSQVPRLEFSDEWDDVKVEESP